MKRSEAAKIIRDRVRQLNNNLWFFEKFSMVDAFQLLNTLEELGMIPPSTYLEIFERSDNGWEPEYD